MNVIETESLTYRYGRHRAVDDLSLGVPEGSAFALLGPNGAGKTTTLKLLMNLLRPTAGTARVLGTDTRKLGCAELARIGYVSENQRLPGGMTVRGLIEWCRPLYPTWDRGLEASLLKQFELPAEQRLEHLSRGLGMKAALLVSLSYRPSLLIFDEPFSGLDPLSRDEFVQGLLAAAQAGDWTLLISSHDVEEVERLCDWVGLIQAGGLVATESTESLLSRFRRVEVALSVPGSSEALAMASWLEMESGAGRIGFADSGYSGATSEQRYREVFPGGTITVRTMPLREIYLILARSARAEAKGSAS